MSKIIINDMTLRDGMHPMRHQTTPEQMVAIATALDDAGVPLIEVTHGDGLGGNSVNYGFAAATDEEYLSAVIPQLKQAKVSALLIPGIGTVDHLQMAYDVGVSTIRVATHSTEADVSEQHITAARKLGMDTVGFLMMAHMASPERLLEEAKKMVADIIEEYYRYFSPETLTKKDAIQVIEEKIKAFTDLLNQQADYDHQLYYAEKIDLLEEALHILKE